MNTTEGQKWIARRLREFGFNIALKDTNKYLKALRSHMGLQKREAFLDKIDFQIGNNSENLEKEITKIIVDDVILLKMVYSTNIQLSIIILDHIMDIIDELDIDPQHIVDFGGANGWSLLLLKEFLETNVKLSLIEENINWGTVDKSINCVFEPYKSATLPEQADLGISIFGSPYIHYRSFVQSVSRNLMKESTFIATLRISKDELFKEFIELMKTENFSIDVKTSKRVKINFETFPIMVFKRNFKSNIKILSMDELELIK